MREKLEELERLRGAATGSKEYFVPYGGSEVYSAAKVFVARFMRTADAKWFAAIHNAFPAILEYVRGLKLERDDAQAQLEVASNNARHYADRTAELEAHAADLRGALDWINRRGGCGLDVHDRINAALARTPAQSLGRIKAEALREAVEEVRNDEAAQESAATTRGAILCIADRLEVKDGR